MMRRAAAVVAGLCLAAGLARGDEVFARKPTVKAEGNQVRIEFTLAAPTDVEVAVLDAEGKVVRHVAAGTVGREAAAPPLAPKSLAQVLVWDRLDDLGKPAAGEKFTVRVRAGMRVAFGRTVGGSPYVVGDLRGIATDKDGRLYLMSQLYRAGGGKSAGPRHLLVFSRDGKYLKSIMPYSNTLKREEAAGFGLIDTGGPALTPRNYEGVWPQVYPLLDLRLQPAVSDTGHVVLVDDDGLYRIDTRGAAVNDFKPVPLWAGEKPRTVGGPFFAAISADGSRLYVAGPYAALAGADDKIRDAWPKGRVYVLHLAEGGGVKPFVTVPIDRDRDLEVPAAARTLRRPPHGPVHGLAADRAGNVYVCDRANDLLRVYDRDAKPVGQFPVRQPHLVAVHPTSGEVYVLTLRPLAYGRNEAQLLKFAGRKMGSGTLTVGSPTPFSESQGPTAGQPAARLDLPAETSDPQLAIDASARPTVLWLTGARGSEVWRIEDRGNALEVAGKLPVSDSGALYGADRLAVDYETDDLYVNDGWSSMARYSGLTGEGGVIGESRALRQVWERDTNQRKNLTATDATVGPDGLVYFRSGPQYSGPVTRWTRALTPAPFAATNSHVLRRYIYSRYGAGYGERGLAVHPDGRVFVMSMYNWNEYFVHGFAPDGRPIPGSRLKGQIKAYTGLDADVDSAIVGPLTAGCGGLKVDAAGNLYVGMRLFPDGFAAPAGFEKDGAYQRLAGSVFKFGPDGGGVGRGAAGAPGLKCGGAFVEGAVKAYPDFAPFSGAHGSGCVCRNPRFDLDPFGRLYVPNALRYSVAVLDNAGNEILRFGRYGNFDDAGAGPDIPLGWPIAAGVSKKAIYVSDMLNKRVVRADVTYAATEEAAIPAAVQPTADDDPAARIARVVAAEARPLSTACAQPRFERDLALFLRRQAQPPTAADGRVNLLHLTRLIPDWPAAEAEAVARKYLADGDPRVRLAALWALDRDDVDDVTVTLAKTALKDEDERVRTLAAILLFDRGHADGLGVLLAGAQGADQWVLDMARPVATEEVVVDGGPRYLKYPVGPKEVDQAIALLNQSYNNMRWVGAGIVFLSGDGRAAKVLAERLGIEDIYFIRSRIIGALQRMRAREGVPPLLADVSRGPGVRKKDTSWASAEALAGIGDPEMVDPLIALLDQEKTQDLALFALSRAFDEAVAATGEYRLVPDAQGGLAKVLLTELPPPAERKKAWTAWWSANKAKFQWDAKQHPLRTPK